MRSNVSKLWVSRQPHSPSATGTGGLWGRWVMAPPRLSVRAGMRAVALRLLPCVRAGICAVGDRSRSGRCPVRMPCVRAGRLAEADPASPTPPTCFAMGPRDIGAVGWFTSVPSTGFMRVGGWLKTSSKQRRARS